MKRLLNKSLRTLALYSLLVLAASAPVYFYLVDGIWIRELDEHNEIVVDRIQHQLRAANIPDTALSQNIAFWNRINPGTTLQQVEGATSGGDSLYTVIRDNPYKKGIDRFQGLSRTVQVNNRAFRLTVETNVEETEETAAAIALVTILFFIILIVGFLVLTKRLSVRLWKPFRNTLAKLKTFNLNNQQPVQFDRSDTVEFEELNSALNNLIAHSLSVYGSQKEFTENASHELQTPLAIIKGKLDLLLQTKSLSHRQYSLIEEADKALTRITRINKNLLLLAKIENHQFEDDERVNVSLLAKQCAEQLAEHFDNKNLRFHSDIDDKVTVEGNKTLTEMLVNNLLLNAIRHNGETGTVNLSVHCNYMAVSNSGHSALERSVLFNRFANVSDKQSGSGLGLAIIKEICHRHGWTINYDFEDNLHRFTIRF